MNISEYINKNPQAIDGALKYKNIDEFKKFAKKIADENKIKYTEEELKQAWTYLQSQKAPSEDGGLDDDALGAVAGGFLNFNSKSSNGS